MNKYVSILLIATQCATTVTSDHALRIGKVDRSIGTMFETYSASSNGNTIISATRTIETNARSAYVYDKITRKTTRISPNFFNTLKERYEKELS